METWVLVISAFAFAAGDYHGSSRTRDLPLDACLTMVQEVKGPRTIAYCYRTGDKDPGYGPWAWGWGWRDRTKEPGRTQDCAAQYFRGSCMWPLPPGRKRV